MARILVAEDDAAQRLMVRTILEVAGHAVAEATNGREALDMLRAESFDAVLLDVMMPELSGYEVLDEVAGIEGFDTPVIMITAQNDPGGIAREARSGALEHISKPYRVEELEDTLRRVLAWTAEERAARAAALRSRAATYDAVAHLRETLIEPEPKRRR